MFVCVLRRVFILVTRFSGCVGDESTARAGDSPCVAWAQTSYSTSSAPQQSVLPRALELCTDVSQGHTKAATLDNTGGSQPTLSCLAHTWSPVLRGLYDYMSLAMMSYLPRRRRDLGSSSLLKQRQDVSWDPCCHKTRRVISTLAVSSINTC